MKFWNSSKSKCSTSKGNILDQQSLSKPFLLSHNTFFFYLLFGILLNICTNQPTHAANLVSGRYVSAGGTNIVLSLSVKTSSPCNIIVEQYLTPGNRIAGTSPRAKKADSRSGKVKWLFRNARSGNITLSTQLKAPLKGSVRAMVRYRTPKGGQFTELQISP